MPYTPEYPDWLFEPTSIGTPVESSTCQFPDCIGDPKAPGRLDEVTFLLERCYKGDDWPSRKASTSLFSEDDRDQRDSVKIPKFL
jgi:hypothetical protein